MSNKGAYWKHKTKQYFTELGYETGYLEKLVRIQTKDTKTGKPKVIYVKQDLFGADGMSMNETDTILWGSCTKANLSRNIAKFKQYPAGGLKRWLVVWEPRKPPEIVEVE